MERENVGFPSVLPPKPFTFYVSLFTNDKDGLFEHPAGVFLMRGGFVEGWSNQINQYSDKGPLESKGLCLVCLSLLGNTVRV